MGVQYADLHLDTHPDADPFAHAYSDLDADAHAYVDTHYYADTNLNADTDTHPHRRYADAGPSRGSSLAGKANRPRQ